MLFGDGTPKKALLTALVVGTILTLINHGDLIFQGKWPPPIKMLLTYCVPYCVTTWGAFTGKRARLHLSIQAEDAEK
ncbi:MAG: nitrate/nitrite transporter NrtS [Paracoccaceae bacterium]